MRRDAQLLQHHLLQVYAFSIALICTFVKNHLARDFPGGPVVKNPPSNAGDAGSIPGKGTRIPHATGQLGPHTTATELARLN